MPLNENLFGQAIKPLSLQDTGAKAYDAYRDKFNTGTTVSDDLVNLMLLAKQRGTSDIYFQTALGNLISGNTDQGTKQLASRQLEIVNHERAQKGQAALNVPGSVTMTFNQTAPGAFNEAPPTAPGHPSQYGFYSIYNQAVSKYQADLASYNTRKSQHAQSVASYNAALSAFQAQKAEVDSGADAVLARSAAIANQKLEAGYADDPESVRKARADSFRTSLLNVAARITARPTNLVTPSSVLYKPELGGTDDRK